jgi:hypothetical protein
MLVFIGQRNDFVVAHLVGNLVCDFFARGVTGTGAGFEIKDCKYRSSDGKKINLIDFSAPGFRMAAILMHPRSASSKRVALESPRNRPPGSSLERAVCGRRAHSPSLYNCALMRCIGNNLCSAVVPRK